VSHHSSCHEAGANVERVTVRKVLVAGGILAPILWATVFLYVGTLRPGYSHTRQHISALAERGSSTQHLMQVAGFLVQGLMLAGFGVAMGLASGSAAAGVSASLVTVAGLAKISAGIFVPDPCCSVIPASTSQHIHNASGAIHFLTLAGAAALCGVSGTTLFGSRVAWLQWYSLASVVLAVSLPPLLIATGIAGGGDVGLFQRASFGVLNLWILVSAIFASRD
jgi:hypothetical membrane protein